MSRNELVEDAHGAPNLNHQDEGHAYQALTEIKKCQTGEISDLDWNGTSQFVDGCGMSRNELAEDAHGAPDLNHQDEGRAHQALTEINTC
jgi:hypothetical protein